MLGLLSEQELQRALSPAGQGLRDSLALLQGNLELALLRAAPQQKEPLQQALQALRRLTLQLQCLLGPHLAKGEALEVAPALRACVHLLQGELQGLDIRLQMASGLWPTKAAVAHLLLLLLLCLKEGLQKHAQDAKPLLTIKADNVETPLGDFVRLLVLRVPAEVMACSSQLLALTYSMGGWAEFRPGPALCLYVPRAGEPLEGELAGGTEELLLLEAEPLSATGALLEHLGYRVHRASGAREALGLLKKRVQLAVVDAPLQGARELLRRLRLRQSGLKALLIGGEASEARRLRACHLQKPFSLAQLAGAVRKALGSTGQNLQNHLGRIKLCYVRTEGPPWRQRLQDACQVYELFSHLALECREQFVVLLLDRQKRLLGYDTVALGTVGEAVVYPQEVVRPALLAGADALLLVHNHPSGCLRPSLKDMKLTAAVKEACSLLGLELTDHVIITQEGFFSFASEGML
jgi:DNA repair protein RadC